MHIALGVRTAQFPVDNFLGASGQTAATISAAADRGGRQVEELAFSGNPNRRGGEWRIRDQYSHRHPAWSSTAGFPTTYNAGDPPYILIFKVGKSFHARFYLESQLRKLSSASMPRGILTNGTGIAAAPSAFVDSLLVPDVSRLDEFEIQRDAEAEEQFDPKNILDGRKRIIASVIRRLGQQTFRQKLVSAYGGQCAMTKCRTPWVLEAAHISPYRGLKTNAVTNGLLLRADVHTLFDLALVAIEPTKLVMRVSKRLEGSLYEALDGQPPVLPAKTALHPSMAALKYHYGFFQP
ncbi:HNH endonuclease [Rhizobium ruizarguesonis]